VAQVHGRADLRVHVDERFIRQRRLRRREGILLLE
jgi:hypothetical protein